MKETIITVGDRSYRIRTLRDNEEISVDGREHKAHLTRIHGGLYSLTLDSRSYDLYVRLDGGNFLVLVEGSEYNISVENKSQSRGPAIAVGSREHATFEIRSPMPGLVSSLRVTPGSRVALGSALLTLDAMKMENEIRSPREGTVSEVLVESGQSVEKDDVLIRLRL